MKIILKEGQELYDVDGNKYLIETNDFISLKERENSLSQLNDIDLVYRLVDFIKTNPFPTDDDFHNFAQENNIDPDKMEQYAYAMLSIFFTGGASKGYILNANDQNNFNIGLQIEQEHVQFDQESIELYQEIPKAVLVMQDCMAQKIMFDHLAESPTYYENDLFTKELEKESK